MAGYRERVNTWFNDPENVSPALRNSTVHATLPNLNNTLTTAASDERNSDDTAVSQPIGLPGGLPFFLSPADLNDRLGNINTDRQAFAPNGTTTVGTGCDLLAPTAATPCRSWTPRATGAPAPRIA